MGLKFVCFLKIKTSKFQWFLDGFFSAQTVMMPVYN